MPDPTATRLRRGQQDLIDAEVRASRRALLASFRDRLRTDATTLADDEFLALADRQVVLSAITVSARAVADACVLYTADPDTATLRIAHHHGLPAAFLDVVATVDTATPSACGTALATGDPVLIDDITTSPIFDGRPTLDVTLTAGIRAVQSYPLVDRGVLLGMRRCTTAPPPGTPGRNGSPGPRPWRCPGSRLQHHPTPTQHHRHPHG